MDKLARQKHWDNIYQTKDHSQMSWFENKPQTSLDFVTFFDLPKTSQIIDIGGGDTFFVDHLLEMGYLNITVLDISRKAIQRAKSRLGDRAKLVNWIVSDISDFQPTQHYDFWHDRAAFHFLTDEKEIQAYRQILLKALQPKSIFVVATFSDQGPQKCSGIEIRQYTESDLEKKFGDGFKPVKSLHVNHYTPFDTVQDFVFCVFTRQNELT
ncbi:MAG: class I SAM-dependent methyltransferase [Psychroflexus sp.]|nr:class I SAM-dependent methyltransferase [Psychroflexus sp.]MDN6310513.1 class I SAM-dependent methyltransferase [Psychroflexus sp.]